MLSYAFTVLTIGVVGRHYGEEVTQSVQNAESHQGWLSRSIGMDGPKQKFKKHSRWSAPAVPQLSPPPSSLRRRQRRRSRNWRKRCDCCSARWLCGG